MIDNIGHSGTKAEGYTRGLQSVFAKPSLTIAAEDLKRCAGKYGLTPQMTVDFVEDDGRLTLLVPGNVRIPLYASSDTTFYAKGMYLNVSFQKNNAGSLNGCEIEQYSGRQILKRIE